MIRLLGQGSETPSPGRAGLLPGRDGGVRSAGACALHE